MRYILLKLFKAQYHLEENVYANHDEWLVDLPDIPTISNQKNGAIGIDLNSDNIATEDNFYLLLDTCYFLEQSS